MAMVLNLLLMALMPQVLLAQSIGSQNCHGEDAFPGHGDVAADAQSHGSENCAIYSGIMVPGIEPVTWIYEADGVPYHYLVSWIDECDGGPQDFLEPVAGSNCVELLKKDWKDCINGGAGGWIDVGCVRYEFKPSE